MEYNMDIESKIQNNKFKIVTWNINSIRARVKHLENLIKTHDPDVICLQETKAQDNLFPLDIFHKLA